MYLKGCAMVMADPSDFGHGKNYFSSTPAPVPAYQSFSNPAVAAGYKCKNVLEPEYWDHKNTGTKRTEASRNNLK